MKWLCAALLMAMPSVSAAQNAPTPLFANDNVAGSPVVSAFGDGSNGLITLEIDRSLLNQPGAEDRLGE